LPPAATHPLKKLLDIAVCDEGIGCVPIKITVTSFMLLLLDAAKLSDTICNTLFGLWEQANYARSI
jgi:hypothetical protein